MTKSLALMRKMGASYENIRAKLGSKGQGQELARKTKGFNANVSLLGM